MTSKLNVILENSLYFNKKNTNNALSKTKADYQSDTELLKQCFWINMIGFLGLFGQYPNETRLITYLKTADKVRIGNINDESHDVAIVTQLAADAKLVNATFTNEFTKLLYILKTRTGVVLDEAKILDLFKKITPQASVLPAQPILKKIVMDWLNGNATMADSLPGLYNVALSLKICADYQLFYRTLRNKTPDVATQAATATTVKAAATTTPAASAPVSAPVVTAPAPLKSKKEETIDAWRQYYAVMKKATGIDAILGHLYVGIYRLNGSNKAFFELMDVAGNTFEKNLLLARILRYNMGYGSDQHSAISNAVTGKVSSAQNYFETNVVVNKKYYWEDVFPGINSEWLSVKVDANAYKMMEDLIDENMSYFLSNSSAMNNLVSTMHAITRFSNSFKTENYSPLRWMIKIFDKTPNQSTHYGTFGGNAYANFRTSSLFREMLKTNILSGEDNDTSNRVSFDNALRIFNGLNFKVFNDFIDELPFILKGIPIGSNKPVYSEFCKQIFENCSNRRALYLADDDMPDGTSSYFRWFSTLANLYFTKTVTVSGDYITAKLISDMYLAAESTHKPAENPLADTIIKSLEEAKTNQTLNWFQFRRKLLITAYDIMKLKSPKVDKLFGELLDMKLSYRPTASDLVTDINAFFAFVPGNEPLTIEVFEYVDKITQTARPLYYILTESTEFIGDWVTIRPKLINKAIELINQKENIVDLFKETEQAKNSEKAVHVLLGQIMEVAFNNGKIFDNLLAWKDLREASLHCMNFGYTNLTWPFKSIRKNALSKEYDEDSYGKLSNTKSWYWANFLVAAAELYMVDATKEAASFMCFSMLQSRAWMETMQKSAFVSGLFEKLVLHYGVGDAAGLGLFRIASQMFDDSFAKHMPEVQNMFYDLMRKRYKMYPDQFIRMLHSVLDNNTNAAANRILNETKTKFNDFILEMMRTITPDEWEEISKETIMSVRTTVLAMKFIKKNAVSLPPSVIKVFHKTIIDNTTDFEESTGYQNVSYRDAIDASPELYVGILESVAKRLGASVTNSWLAQSRIEKTVNNSGIALFYSSLKEASMPIDQKRAYLKRALDAIKINNKGVNRLGAIVDKIVTNEAVISAINHLTKKALIPITTKVTEKNMVEILKFNNFEVDFSKSNIKSYKSEKVDAFDHLMAQTAQSIVSVPDLKVTKTELKDPANDLDVISTELFKLCNGRHGDVAPKVLEVFDVDMQTDEFKDMLAKKEYKSILRAFHGTGSIAASMILRFGFKVLKDSVGGVAVTGKMLGDGIYCSPVTDKAMQYCSDDGYSRGIGNVGYLFDMDVYLNRESYDYRSAGTGGDSIRSAEYCIPDARKYIHIKKVYKVELISIADATATKERVEAMQSVQVHAAEDVRPSKFKRFLIEDEGRHESGLYRATFVFYDGTVPYKNKIVDFDQFIDATKDTGLVELGYSQDGPEITILTELEPTCLLAMIPDTDEMIAKDPDGLYSYWLAITANL